MKYYNIIKYTGLTATIYLTNSMMSNIINSKIILQLIIFIIIIIFIDALNLQEEYILLQDKYKSLQNTEIIFNNHFKDINLKLGILLSKTQNKKHYDINVEYKKLNKSKSFTFKNKETIF